MHALDPILRVAVRVLDRGVVEAVFTPVQVPCAAPVGAADRTYRMEEGTLVTVAKRVQQEYNRYLTMVKEQRVD